MRLWNRQKIRIKKHFRNAWHIYNGTYSINTINIYFGFFLEYQNDKQLSLTHMLYTKAPRTPLRVSTRHRVHNIKYLLFYILIKLYSFLERKPFKIYEIIIITIITLTVSYLDFLHFFFAAAT